MLQIHTETHGQVQVELKFVNGEKIAVGISIWNSSSGMTVFLGEWFPVF